MLPFGRLEVEQWFRSSKMISLLPSAPDCMRVFFQFILSGFVAALFAGCSHNPSGEAQGYIEGEYVYIAAPLGGALTNLAVARGDQVTAGQLLFALERGSEASAA